MKWNERPLLERPDERCIDGEGINVTKQDVLSLIVERDAPRRLVAELDRIHDAEHDSYDPCDCYERLAKAVRGEGLFFPEVEQGCDEPPEYGCETPMQAFARGISARVAAAVYGDTARLAELSGHLLPDGLAARLAERIINPPVCIPPASGVSLLPGDEARFAGYTENGSAAPRAVWQTDDETSTP